MKAGRFRPIKVMAVALAVVFSAAACGDAVRSVATIPPDATASATPGETVLAASDAPSGSASGSASAPIVPTVAPGVLQPGDWPVYHLDGQRSGNLPDFAAPQGTLAKAWSTKLDGAVYAEPLVVHGQVIAATENNSVYALDPQSGKTLWSRHYGTPVPLSTLPCGNIDPLGITGTPAYDPATNSLFVVEEVTGPQHVLLALDPSNGAILWGREVDVAGQDPATHQQRPALAVANGYVYVGFGGLDGDCGQYTGKVVGVPTTGGGNTIVYQVPVAREGAVWATGGPVIDSSGNLYVSTGNGSSTTKYDGSDSVIELSPTLQQIGFFAPSTWAADNANDADLGSLSPVLLPNGLLFIAGKRGTGYVLRQGALGGIGAQVASAEVCPAFGAAAVSGSSIFLPCRTQLRMIQVSADGTISPGWINPTAGGPPVVGSGAVWSLTGSQLYAIDPSNGKLLSAIDVGAVPNFASPTLWKGLVLCGTKAGVVAVSA